MGPLNKKEQIYGNFPSLSLKNPANRAPTCPGFGMVGLSHLPNRSALDDACSLNTKGLRGDQRIPKRGDMFVVIQMAMNQGRIFFDVFKLSIFF